MKLKHAVMGLAFVVAGNVATAALEACTTFCVRAGDRVLFGRNYDFEHGDGMVMVNAEGLRKRGFYDNGPSWRAAFGSVTFNQYGRGFPMGGMNTAGLVVELMWLDETVYPEADARAPLTVLEWIQYQLDTAGTVNDVLASDTRVRIQGGPPLHYLVSDRSGATATVEFLSGRLVAHRDATLAYSALANDSYQRSAEFLKARSGRPAGGSGSLERFSRAATALPAVAGAGAAAVDRAFGVLADVAQGATRWSIVYDQSAGVIHWRTDRHAAIRRLRISDVPFACGSAPLALDVHAKISGDARAHFVPLTAAANRALIATSMSKTSFLRRTPPDAIDRDAAYGFGPGCAS